MPRTPEERDPSSFTDALNAFEGARYSLDPGSTKVLRLMLEPVEGCDARISADHFELRFGWHPSRHRFDLRAAPAVLGRILELADASPGAWSVRAVLPPIESRGWSCGPRRVWLNASPTEVVVQVRIAEDASRGADEMPSPLPDSTGGGARLIDFALPLACPRCSAPSPSFRHLLDGALVCASCGQSFFLPD
jgi:hypothetical protein